MVLQELEKLFWEDKIYKLVDDTFLKYEKNNTEPNYTNKEYVRWLKEVNISQFSDMLCISKLEDSTFYLQCSISGKEVITICSIAITFTFFEEAENLSYGFSKKKSLEIGFYEFAERFSKFYLENLPKWNETKVKFLKDSYIKK